MTAGALGFSRDGLVRGLSRLADTLALEGKFEPPDFTAAISHCLRSFSCLLSRVAHVAARLGLGYFQRLSYLFKSLTFAEHRGSHRSPLIVPLPMFADP